MSKIRHYFSTFVLIRGFLIALFGSAFLYLNALCLHTPLLNTLFALISLSLLLLSPPKVWFWGGFFFALFWFWWIALSFQHYALSWLIPFVVLLISLIYGLLFLLLATLSQHLSHLYQTPYNRLFRMVGYGVILLSLSLIHPFGFNWFKPELLLTESYLGVQKWQFGLLLLTLIVYLYTQKPLVLLLLLISYAPPAPIPQPAPQTMALISTHISVEQKWNPKMIPQTNETLLATIKKAIQAKKEIVILPESVFPLFLNYEHTLFQRLQTLAKKITIVTGGLYWDGKTPKNSTYIFHPNGKVTLAHKVLLVPFGEANPLPDFLSHWVNKIFYDGAVDYKAEKHLTDYTINGITYRNAICFEATSEKLYTPTPKQMIVLSNNGWFTPSIEPTLQSLLLRYYHKKYGTTIYHSVNGSSSYMIASSKN